MSLVGGKELDAVACEAYECDVVLLDGSLTSLACEALRVRFVQGGAGEVVTVGVIGTAVEVS